MAGAKKTRSDQREKVLTLADLSRATLARQMLLKREKMTVSKALDRLLAIQAQWPKPPFLALHARLKEFERSDLTSAALKYEVVRGTGFRSTIFLMNAKDYACFRGSIVASLEKSVKSIVKKEHVPEEDHAKIVRAGRDLFAAKPRSFNDLRAELQKWGLGVAQKQGLGVAQKKNKGVDPGVIRLMAYLIRLRVPLLQVPTEEQTWGWHAACDFALADSLITNAIVQDEQNDELVLRYLAALGPASIADAQNFLGMTKLKDSFERLRPKLVTFVDEKKRELFDLPNSPRPGADADAPVRFLPDFDNVVMGHQDRTRFVSEEHKPYIYLKGLVVNRTYLIDGRVAGTWRVDATKKAATLVVEPFAAIPKKWKSAVEEEAATLARFFEPDAATHDVTFAKPKT